MMARERWDKQQGMGIAEWTGCRSARYMRMMAVSLESFEELSKGLDGANKWGLRHQALPFNLQCGAFLVDFPQFEQTLEVNLRELRSDGMR
jgi:hypothetical protein